MPEQDLPPPGDMGGLTGLTNSDRYDNLARFIERTSGGRYPEEGVRNRLAAAHALDRDGNIRNPDLLRQYGGDKRIGRQGWEHVIEGGSP